VLSDKARQVEGAAASAGAAADASLAELRMALEGERSDARRAKLEASSTAKQYEQLVQRLRREADASADEVVRLRALVGSMQAATTGSVKGPVRRDDDDTRPQAEGTAAAEAAAQPV
jgi:hypothetical protein